MGDLTSIYGIEHFRLATNLPANSSLTIHELAKKSSMHPNDADALIRHGITRRIFLQKEDGTIGHSAVSKTLATSPGIASYVGGNLGNMWVAAPHLATAMEKWPGSQEINQTAYNIAHRTDLSFFEHIGNHETNARKFAESMTFMQSAPPLKADFALEYDWVRHANGVVVDVGGSEGIIAFKLADKYPDMQIIVQDRPEVIALADARARTNVLFQSHDFFAPQPVKGADVYFFRWILHDWPNKHCISILRALIPALKPGARMVLMDAVIPEPGVLSPYQERTIRDYDIMMRVLFNARERSESGWRNLIGEAFEEGRFEIVEVLRPRGSQLGFLVVEWKG